MQENTDINLLLKNYFSKTVSLSRPSVNGGNNHGYIVNCGDERYFLKRYFSSSGDRRNRCETEFVFSEYCWGFGEQNIPKPIKKWGDQNLALFSFLPGERLSCVDEKAVSDAARFIHNLNKDVHKKAQLLPNASDASFSLSGHLSNIEGRLSLLSAIKVESSISEQVINFVKQEMKPLFAQFCDCANSSENDYADLPKSGRIISPSDFGFHNALNYKNKLYFLDFEYGGWDDPAKLLVDFFLQPEIPVPSEYFSLFVERAFPSHCAESLTNRSKVLHTFLCVKWACILLNSFILEGKNRRTFAKKIENPEQQLRKAKQMLKRANSREQYESSRFIRN